MYLWLRIYFVFKYVISEWWLTVIGPLYTTGWFLSNPVYLSTYI